MYQAPNHLQTGNAGGSSGTISYTDHAHMDAEQALALGQRTARKKCTTPRSRSGILKFQSKLAMQVATLYENAHLDAEQALALGQHRAQEVVRLLQPLQRLAAEPRDAAVRVERVHHALPRGRQVCATPKPVSECRHRTLGCAAHSTDCAGRPVVDPQNRKIMCARNTLSTPEQSLTACWGQLMDELPSTTPSMERLHLW